MYYESSILKQLDSSKGIVQLYDNFVYDEDHCMILEYLDYSLKI